MSLTPLLVTYGTVGLVLSRRFAWRIWDNDAPRRERYRDPWETPPYTRTGAYLLGLIQGLIWPMVLFAFLCWWLADNKEDQVFKVFFSEPRRERKERKLEEARKRTAQLERELGM